MARIVFWLAVLLSLSAIVAARPSEADVATDDEIAEKSSIIRRKRAAFTTQATLWDKTKPIAYSLDHSLGQIVIDAFHKWMKRITENTCLDFKQDTTFTVTPRIHVNQGAECEAESIGMNPVDAVTHMSLNIANDCAYGTIPAHELFHVLGCFHEFDRMDRDDYLDVFMDRIPEGYKKLYRKNESADSLDTPYEIGSMMHPNDNQIPGSPRQFELKDKQFGGTMGNVRTITFYDYKGLNMMYKCGELCPTQLACQNGGYTHPRNCSICVCPSYFEGALCEKIINLVELIPSNSTITILNEFKVEFSAVDIPSNERDNPDTNRKIAPKLYKSPVGTRLNVSIIDMKGSNAKIFENPDYPAPIIQCVSKFSECNAYGLELTGSKDYGLTGKIFCCPESIGQWFVTDSNWLGVSAYAAMETYFMAHIDVAIVN